ncbi:MAG TPA: exopolysaccharide biosynthesis polyprenyl glycosylphosphotransferase [Streptosporangiaceae bacterium]|nr:exopolysaccharide biosynthesis polyprenyl glycosylphosphotransferase [Streptosporangiaceae bacterium]
MTADYGQRGADTDGFRAVPAALPADGGLHPPRRRVRAGRRASRIAPVIAMPLADVLGLAAAIAVTRPGGLIGVFYALAVLILLAASGLQRLRICLRVSDQAGRILAVVALPLLILLPWMAAGSAARLALCSAGLVFAFRIAVSAVLRAAHRGGLLTEAALVVGAGTFGAHIGDLMREHPELGLRPLGYLDHGPPRKDLALPSLGAPDDLAEVVTRLGIRRVIVCYASCKDEDLVTVLRASRPLRADVCVVPRLYEVGMAVPRSCLDELWGLPLIPLRRSGHATLGLAMKRAFDVAIAATLLIAAVPVLLVLAFAIRLRTGQAPLFRQERVTGRGRTASVVKLRTLTGPADPDTSWGVSDHERSSLGNWLRATHLDELPQLWNVLRGDMSLVGPRPERPYFAEQFGREILRYSDRGRMQAGLTGWAQVHGLNGDTSIVDRARFDNQYIEYWSPWLDVVILTRTLVASITHRQEGGQQ